MRLVILGCVAAGVILFGGCAGSESQHGRAKRVMGIAPQEVYLPLSDYNLTLRHEGTKVLKTGEGGRITFALRNAGDKSIRLIEWYSNEPDNVVVYCQPWLTGMTAPDEAAWTELSFDVKLPSIRYPLELMPGNQVLVTKELPFVDKLAITPGAERRFFIRGKLNLKSVSVSSPVSVIAVRPGSGDTPSGNGAGAGATPR